MFKFLSIILVSVLVIYLITSFVVWDLNPAKWGLGVRLLALWLDFILSLAMIVLYINYKDNK